MVATSQYAIGLKPDVVQNALNRIVFTSTHPDTPGPLVSMALIDEFLDQLAPGLAVAEENLRDYALQRVLTNVIRAELAHPPSADVRPGSATRYQNIAQDSRAVSTPLLALKCA